MKKSGIVCILFFAVVGSAALILSCGGSGGGGGGGLPDVLFFAGNDGAGGASFNNNLELWSYDGVSPVQVAEIGPGTSPSYPWWFTSLDDLVIFSARNDSQFGREVYATDGTDAWLVKDIDMGVPGSSPRELKEFKGKVYMIASVGGSSQLWQTDGTEAGTVVTVGPGQGILQVIDFGVLQDQKIYFTGQSATDGYGLFQTDGTPAIMDSISVGFVTVGEMAMRGSDIFFVADDGVRGRELWMSSGPGTGATIVADIEAGAGDSSPDHLTLMGSVIVFNAERLDVGRELWYSWGPADMTTLVADINPGASDSSPWSLAVHGGLLYFTADDGTHGYEPFATDLSAPSILADINSVDASNPWHYQEYKGKVYFYADDGIHGTELWVTDGTGPGTEMVFDLNPNGNGAWPD